jgi:protein SCO1/2
VVAAALLIWVAATLFWWAFAFAPLPSAPPPWLAAARAACFGASASGLPDAAGWMMLTLAPAMLLIAIVVLWGREVRSALAATLRARPGRVLIAVLALVAGAQAAWVASRIVTAARIEGIAITPASASARLAPDYPRQHLPAPDFALVDQHGVPLGPGALRGRPIVLTFVFAHCATLCPVVVETVKQATAGTDPPVVLLVTLDPWRDTPSSLPALAKRWSLPPHAHILSAARAPDVLAVAGAYAVPFERNETTGDIAHPPLVFVIDRDGRLAYTFNNPPVEWIAQALVRIG